MENKKYDFDAFCNEYCGLFDACGSMMPTFVCYNEEEDDYFLFVAPLSIEAVVYSVLWLRINFKVNEFFLVTPLDTTGVWKGVVLALNCFYVNNSFALHRAWPIIEKGKTFALGDTGVSADSRDMIFKPSLFVQRALRRRISDTRKVLVADKIKAYNIKRDEDDSGGVKEVV